MKTTSSKTTKLDALEQVITKVEKANWRIAEEKVIEYEAKRGWMAEKVERLGYDILSVQGEQKRHIEVKSKLGSGKKFGWTELTANETKQFQADPNYFVYLVEGESIEPGTPFVVIELDKKKLEEIAEYHVKVKFTRLTGLKRTSTQ